MLFQCVIAATLAGYACAGEMAYCFNDACLAAARWDRGECESFFKKTVTPTILRTATCTKTITAPAIATGTTTITYTIAPVITVPTTVTETDEATTTVQVTDEATSTDFITETSLTTVYNTETIVTTVEPTETITFCVKKLLKGRRTISSTGNYCPKTTPAPSKLPQNARACRNTNAYSSACSCLGVTHCTTTAVPCTSTTTTTSTKVVGQTTSTRELTSTDAITSPTTVYATATVATTLVSSITVTTTIEAIVTSDATTLLDTITSDTTVTVTTTSESPSTVTIKARFMVRALAGTFSDLQLGPEPGDYEDSAGAINGTLAQLHDIPEVHVHGQFDDDDGTTPPHVMCGAGRDADAGLFEKSCSLFNNTLFSYCETAGIVFRGDETEEGCEPVVISLQDTTQEL